MSQDELKTEPASPRKKRRMTKRDRILLAEHNALARERGEPELTEEQWSDPEELNRKYAEQQAAELSAKVNWSPQSVEDHLALCAAVMRVVRYTGILSLDKVLDKIEDPGLRKYLRLVLDGIFPEGLDLILEEHRRLSELLLLQGAFSKDQWSKLRIHQTLVHMLVRGQTQTFHFEEIVREIISPTFLKNQSDVRKAA